MAIAENPNVSITLTGLLVLLVAADKSSCQIGVISNPEHKLRIGALKVTQTSVDPLPLGDFSAGDIRIEVVNPETPGVDFHKGELLFDGLEKGDPNDFRWTPDLEGELFHNEKLAIKKENVSKIIHLNNGLFFTKTVNKVKSIPPAGGKTRLISELTGININFKDTESKLVFTYGPEGKDKLELENLPNTKYKILILNDRPVHPAGGHDGNSEADFKLYYDVFEVPEEKRFKMFDVPGDTLGHPCGMGSGGKTSSF